MMLFRVSSLGYISEATTTTVEAVEMEICARFIGFCRCEIYVLR